MLASNLNSGESFVVIAPGGAKCWAWLGSDSSDSEKAYAKTLCGILAKDATMVEVNESEEDDEFWETLGGKTEYLNFKELGIAPNFEPRLFNMRFSPNEGGAFWMAELPNFN